MIRTQDFRTSVWPVLTIGFGLLMLLLLASVYIGDRAMRRIEQSTEQLVESQLTSTRLLDDLQRVENGLSDVFYSLVGGASAEEKYALLNKLATIEREAAKSLVSAAGKYSGAESTRLKAAIDGLIAEVRQSLNAGGDKFSPSPELSRRHQELTDALSQLAASTFQSAAEAKAIESLHSRNLIKHSLILCGIALLVAMTGAVLTVRFATRVSQRLQWQADELSRLSAHVLESQESTVRRFSRELHDQFGQTLSAIEANLAAIRPSDQQTAHRIDDCMCLVKDAIGEVRELSQLMRPSILDDFGLDASLRWLAEGFSQRTGIEVRYDSAFTDRLHDETETHLFRMAQEALTNVARHSHATKVRMEMFAAGGQLFLIVSDNGRGMQPARDRKGLGLIGMRARARGTGGSLSVESVRDRGVTIKVEVPLEPVKDAQEDPYFVGG